MNPSCLQIITQNEKYMGLKWFDVNMIKVRQISGSYQENICQSYVETLQIPGWLITSRKIAHFLYIPTFFFKIVDNSYYEIWQSKRLNWCSKLPCSVSKISKIGDNEYYYYCDAMFQQISIMEKPSKLFLSSVIHWKHVEWGISLA